MTKVTDPVPNRSLVLELLLTVPSDLSPAPHRRHVGRAAVKNRALP